MVRVLRGQPGQQVGQDSRAMAACPFYREDVASAERRRRRRDDEPVAAPTLPAPWCAHLYSPVTRYVATMVAGGYRKLQCGGDLDKCQVHPRRRPKL